MTEIAIRDYLERYLACPCAVERRLLWAELVKAHQSRPLSVVARMEIERGLR